MPVYRNSTPLGNQSILRARRKKELDEDVQTPRTGFERGPSRGGQGVISRPPNLGGPSSYGPPGQAQGQGLTSFPDLETPRFSQAPGMRPNQPHYPWSPEEMDERVKKSYAGFYATYGVRPSDALVMGLAMHPGLPLGGIINSFPVSAKNAILNEATRTDLSPVGGEKPQGIMDKIFGPAFRKQQKMLEGKEEKFPTDPFEVLIEKSELAGNIDRGIREIAEMFIAHPARQIGRASIGAMPDSIQAGVGFIDDLIFDDALEGEDYFSYIRRKYDIGAYKTPYSGETDAEFFSRRHERENTIKEVSLGLSGIGNQLLWMLPFLKGAPGVIGKLTNVGLKGVELAFAAELIQKVRSKGLGKALYDDPVLFMIGGLSTSHLASSTMTASKKIALPVAQKIIARMPDTLKAEVIMNLTGTEAPGLRTVISSQAGHVSNQILRPVKYGKDWYEQKIGTPIWEAIEKRMMAESNDPIVWAIKDQFISYYGNSAPAINAHKKLVADVNMADRIAMEIGSATNKGLNEAEKRMVSELIQFISPDEADAWRLMELEGLRLGGKYKLNVERTVELTARAQNMSKAVHEEWITNTRIQQMHLEGKPLAPLETRFTRLTPERRGELKQERLHLLQKTFLAKLGWGFRFDVRATERESATGFVSPGAREIVVDKPENVATLAHEVTHILHGRLGEQAVLSMGKASNVAKALRVHGSRGGGRQSRLVEDIMKAAYDVKGGKPGELKPTSEMTLMYEMLNTRWKEIFGKPGDLAGEARRKHVGANEFYRKYFEKPTEIIARVAQLVKENGAEEVQLRLPKMYNMYLKVWSNTPGASKAFMSETITHAEVRQVKSKIDNPNVGKWLDEVRLLEDRIMGKDEGKGPFVRIFADILEQEATKKVQFAELFLSTNRIRGKDVTSFRKTGLFTEEELAQAGRELVKNPGFAAFKEITDLRKKRARYTFYETFAKDRTLSSPVDNPEKGLNIHLGESNGYNKGIGPLFDRWVSPATEKLINRTEKSPGEVQKAWRYLLGWWKWGKVVANPATHVRNMISNTILADMSGINLRTQSYAIPRAALEFKNRTGYMAEMVENTNVMDQTFYSAEVMEALGVYETIKTPNQLLKLIRGAKEWSGEKYQAEEQIWKLMVYSVNRRAGKSIQQSAKQAEKWLFNYDEVAPIIEWARKSPLGSPFVTFTAKALPRVSESMIKRPWKLGKYGLTAWGVEELARGAHYDPNSERLIPVSYNQTQEEVARERQRLPHYMQGSTLGIPKWLRTPWVVKDNRGVDRQQYLNLSYIMPGIGDLGEEGGGLFPSLPRAMQPNTPMITFINMTQNYDAFRQDKIIPDGATQIEAANIMADYMIKQFGPAPLGYSRERLIKSFLKDEYAQPIPQTFLDTFFGLKVKHGVPSPDSPNELGSRTRRSQKPAKDIIRDAVKNPNVQSLDNAILEAKDKAARDGVHLSDSQIEATIDAALVSAEMFAVGQLTTESRKQWVSENEPRIDSSMKRISQANIDYKLATTEAEPIASEELVGGIKIKKRRSKFKPSTGAIKLRNRDTARNTILNSLRPMLTQKNENAAAGWRAYTGTLLERNDYLQGYTVQSKIGQKSLMEYGGLNIDDAYEQSLLYIRRQFPEFSNQFYLFNKKELER